MSCTQCACAMLRATCAYVRVRSAYQRQHMRAYPNSWADATVRAASAEDCGGGGRRAQGGSGMRACVHACMGMGMPIYAMPLSLARTIPQLNMCVC